MKHTVRDWLLFALVHVILITENLVAPNQPLGDVLWTYPKWIGQGLTGGGWQGITAPGVYPFLALIPMYFGALGLVGWFGFVLVINAVAFATVRDHARRAALAWMGFLVLLGPIALGRVDVTTVALGIIVIALMDSNPRIAGALIAAATWVKVWPIILGLTSLLTTRARTIALWAAGIAAALGGIAIAIGGPSNVLGFLGDQQGRGIQVESVAATPWLWDAWYGGASRILYSNTLLTFEIFGPETVTVAAMLTLIEVIVLLALATRIVLHRRRMYGEITTHVLALAITVLGTALIVINKVGSPQFVSWLAVPVVALVVYWHPRWSPPLLSLIGGIALFTRILYPYAYFEFLSLSTGPLLIATFRNLTEVVLLVVATVALVRELRVEELANENGDAGVVDEEGVVAER